MNYSMKYLDCISHTTKLMVNLLRQMHQTTNFNWKHIVLMKFNMCNSRLCFLHISTQQRLHAWTEDVKLISIIKSFGVVSNFKWKAEY